MIGKITKGNGFAGVCSYILVQGATSAHKARMNKGCTQKAPRPNTELIDNEWMGVGRKDKGVPNVW